MEQRKNHKVHHLNESFRNELTIPSYSQIANYGDPITRNRSRHLFNKIKIKIKIPNQLGGEKNQHNKQMKPGKEEKMSGTCIPT
mgnify:CR=1 FL=1